MKYLALYRKFRPLTFDEVVGQSNIVNTIVNQINQQNFGHAYLFSGIRGTGKTSIAKIFSRSINCLNPTGANPCNECEICKSILNGSSMDIVEMDAASHNSVEDIREINDNVNFPPSKSKYKVYIIDEVHMLSKGAFNALLKTLEEPPSYVIFLLATTEPHKIPDTIISRCQRYDLKRVTFSEILKRFEFILKEEDKKYEEKALEIIISKGEGSVRDSLSILEQCLSYDDMISVNLVNDVLGLVERQTLNDITKAIINLNLDSAINIINRIFNEGKDINQFIDSILSYYRDLLIIKMHSKAENLVELSQKQIDEMRDLAESLKLVAISKLIDVFIELENKMKYSTHPRVLLEMGFIKIFDKNSLVTKEELIEKINSLEDKLNKISVNGIKTKNSNEKKDLKDNYNENNKKEYNTAKDIEKYIDSETSINLSMEKIHSNWGEVLKILKKVRIKVYAFIIEGKPISLNGNKILLQFDKDYKFHGDNLIKKQNKETVDTILEKVFSHKLTIDVTYDNNIKDDKEINVNEKVSEYFCDYDKVIEIKD